MQHKQKHYDEKKAFRAKFYVKHCQECVGFIFSCSGKSSDDHKNYNNDDDNKKDDNDVIGVGGDSSGGDGCGSGDDDGNAVWYTRVCKWIL